ncbi:MAG: DUF4893 domain-containing protein [Acidobacteriota bacterium]
MIARWIWTRWIRNRGATAAVVGVVLSLAAVGLLSVAPATADDLPRRYPLVALEPGQDGEDVAAGADHFYAATETVSLTFVVGETPEDPRQRTLARRLDVWLDAALLAEQGPPREDLPDQLSPMEQSLEAPGLGWVVDQTYEVPGTSALLLTVATGPDRQDYLLAQVDPLEGLTLSAPVSVEPTVAAEGRPVDWAFPWFPVDVEKEAPVAGGTSARLTMFETPEPWAEIFPVGGGLRWSERWWRDVVRPHHLHRIDRIPTYASLGRHLLAQAIEAGEDAADAAKSLPLLERLHKGPFVEAAADALVGPWRVRVHSSIDTAVFVYPYFDAEISRRGNDLVFRKTSGSQRRSGLLMRDLHGPGWIFAGGFTVNDDPEVAYSALAGVGEVLESDTVGVLYLLNDAEALMILDAEDALSWELYELKRPASPAR